MAMPDHFLASLLLTIEEAMVCLVHGQLFPRPPADVDW
jgi:hypothetical protein